MVYIMENMIKYRINSSGTAKAKGLIIPPLVSEFSTAPECKPTCFSGAFLFEPYTRKPWGSAPRDQEDIARDEPVRGCRKAGAIQRPAPLSFVRLSKTATFPVEDPGASPGRRSNEGE